MRGTKQVGIWSEMGSFWQPHPTQDQPAPLEEFDIDSRIGAAAKRIPAASKEDSRPQAILKFHPPSSLYYRACHGLPVALYVYIKLFRIVKTLLQNNFVGEWLIFWRERRNILNELMPALRAFFDRFEWQICVVRLRGRAT